MRPSLLAAASAVLFGSMTVALRMALPFVRFPASGAALALLPTVIIAASYAVLRSNWELASAWPYALAGALAPGCSQILFMHAVREAGASRASVTVGAAPLVGSAIAIVALGEPVVAGIAAGALLIVAGGAALATESRRPSRFRWVGIVFAAATMIAFSVRDNLVRWLGTGGADADPALGLLVSTIAGAVVVVTYALARERTLEWRALPRFLPAGVGFGASYVCLFEAYFSGPVTVVSPIVATESLVTVALSALLLRQAELVGIRLMLGALFIVAGGALIGVSH